MKIKSIVSFLLVLLTVCTAGCTEAERLPGITNLVSAQPYKVIGERGIAIDIPERSVGLWLITAETATEFEERAQTVIQAVIDLYSLYNRDFTSVKLIAEEGLENTNYATATFSADGLGPAGMTGSNPANPCFWTVYLSESILNSQELEIARLWQENMENFLETNPLSSSMYDVEALTQYIADTLGLPYEEAKIGEIHIKKYDTEQLLDEWTSQAMEYHKNIKEPDISVEPKPGHYISNAEGKTGIIVGNVQVETGVCEINAYSFVSDKLFEKGESCIVITGNITNLNWDKFNIALWAEGYNEIGELVAETLDSAHIPGQIGMYLETNETGQFTLHINPANDIKVIHIKGAAYLMMPP